MTRGHPSSVEGRLQEVQVASPIEPRGWKKCAAVCSTLTATSLAIIVLLGSDDPIHRVSSPQKPSVHTQASVEVQTEVRLSRKKKHAHSPSPVAPTVPPENAALDPNAPPRTGDALTPQVAETQAPFVEIGALTSSPGEDKEAFLVRLAQVMDLFTRTTQHEICGVIMVRDADSAYRVRLTTNRAHISCTMVVFDEPGFHRLGPDIHSHPREYGGVVANARDVAYRKDFACGQRIYIFDRNFSTVDFDHGAGYLVSRGRLLYQHGNNWPVRQLAVFDRIKEASPLQVGGSNPQVSEELAASAWKNEDRDGVPATTCPPPVVQPSPTKPKEPEMVGQQVILPP